jgi:hypothetical protein
LTHRYRFISEHHATYGVARLCRVLAVKRRQGYYEWLAGEPARQERERAEDELVEHIRAIHAEHRGRYGSPRVHDELRRRGRRVNRKRVERLMRQQSSDAGHVVLPAPWPLGDCPANFGNNDIFCATTG